MTDGTKGGAQRASSLRPRCFREVDPETMTHIYLSIDHGYMKPQIILNAIYNMIFVYPKYIQ
jgi:hypothetical protein